MGAFLIARGNRVENAHTAFTGAYQSGQVIEIPIAHGEGNYYADPETVARLEAEGATVPPILALAGLTDPRVTYWEPAKWVAKLRDHSTSDAPVMLKTNMGAGHGGASGRFSRLEEIAEVYAFALKTVGKAG